MAHFQRPKTVCPGQLPRSKALHPSLPVLDEWTRPHDRPPSTKRWRMAVDTFKPAAHKTQPTCRQARPKEEIRGSRQPYLPGRSHNPAPSPAQCLSGLVVLCGVLCIYQLAELRLTLSLPGERLTLKKRTREPYGGQVDGGGGFKRWKGLSRATQNPRVRVGPREGLPYKLWGSRWWAPR